jgi:hypothetical protein
MQTQIHTSANRLQFFNTCSWYALNSGEAAWNQIKEEGENVTFLLFYVSFSMLVEGKPISNHVLIPVSKQLQAQ